MVVTLPEQGSEYQGRRGRLPSNPERLSLRQPLSLGLLVVVLVSLGDNITRAYHLSRLDRDRTLIPIVIHHFHF